MFGFDGYNDDEILQRQIETLRGCEFERLDYCNDVFTQYFDSGKLCASPLVTVRMITYNHEKFIAKAIEGVVNQKCDFEFELIIGDDCSTDNTFQIALAYQKRFPGIIKLLRGAENTAQKFGNYCANYLRVCSVSRGKYVAMCEGDDWWCDEGKLQKQIDIFRKYNSVAFCWTRSKAYYQEDARFEEKSNPGFPLGRSSGEMLWRAHLSRSIYDIRTASFMFRKIDEDYFRSRLRYFTWSANLGDIPLLLMVASRGDVFLINDVTTVYRIHNASASHSCDGATRVDNICLTCYFSYLLWHLDLAKNPQLIMAFRERVLRIARISGSSVRRQQLKGLYRSDVFAAVLNNPFVRLYYPIAFLARNGNLRLTSLVRHGIVKTCKRQFQRRVLGRAVMEQ